MGGLGAPRGAVAIRLSVDLSVAIESRNIIRTKKEPASFGLKGILKPRAGRPNPLI
jgi:hypothetical protein